MNIVLLDGGIINPGDLSWKEFEQFGTLTIYASSSPEEARERAKDADIVMLSKVVADGDFMDACPRLKLIAELATGYNNVDAAAAKKRGIKVCNTPAYGAKGVAQSVFAHILEITNNVGLHASSVKEGEWFRSPWCYWKRPIIDLDGKTMGVIGYGQIGREAAKLAKAFGMKVLVNSRQPVEGEDNASLARLFAESDVITLHCPLSDETKHLIRKETIAQMKKGVIIINLGRGPLVNEADLAEAAKSGQVYGAGLDVLDVEPPLSPTPAMGCDNINITPHIAWASRASRGNILHITHDNISAFLRGEDKNVVNP